MDSLRAVLRKPNPIFGPEDFHTLRVDIKRIKAVFLLVAATSKKFNRKKLFEPFSTIFRQSGIVRELHLHKSILNKYKPDPCLSGYYDALEDEVRKQQVKFFTLIDKKLKKKLERNASQVVAQLDKINEQAQSEFILAKQNQIDFFLNAEQLAEDEVHELRKQLKEMSYLHKMLKMEDQAVYPTENFQELLGLWHDYSVIGNDLLKDAQNPKRLPEEVKGIMTLHKKISLMANLLLKKIEGAKKTLLPSNTN